MVVAVVAQNVRMSQAQFTAVGAQLSKWRAKLVISVNNGEAARQVRQGGGFSMTILKERFQPRMHGQDGEVVVFPKPDGQLLMATHILLILPEGREDEVMKSASFMRWCSLVVDGSVYFVDAAGQFSRIEDERMQSIPDAERERHEAYKRERGLIE